MCLLRQNEVGVEQTVMFGIADFKAIVNAVTSLAVVSENAIFRKVGVYAQKTSHIMKPGDKIEYNKATHKITATQVHPTDYIEWTKGNMYFEKESLENIMKTLSRIYDVEIRFDSNKLPNEYFTGTIPGGGIQNALNILMLTSPFYYEMDGSVIVLKEK